jgi:Amt family ammonium transporter
MLASLGVISVASLVYFACGFAWQGFVGGPSYAFVVGGRNWDWIAAAPFFLRGIRPDGSAPLLIALLQMFSVSLAALIPLGSGADRWRLSTACISTALLAGWIYPLFAHWVWGGGWLAQLGVNYGLGRGFVDAGGSSTIQALGGLTALAVAWILGPRRGKYGRNRMPAVIPGHNAVLVLFGAVLTLVGWLGLNSAGAILFAGIAPSGAALIAINTTLAAVAGASAAMLLTRIRFGRPDASLTANGWVGGLAASSAACAFVAPASAVVIGLIAGVLVVFAVELLELRLTVDDPGGSIAAHGVGGMWGILALGIFAQLSAPPLGAAEGAGHSSGQGLAQLVGVATLLGFVLPLAYGLNWLLNRVYPLRVSAEGEERGLDLHELGADAYPEFVIHTED